MTWAICPVNRAFSDNISDPVLNLMLDKGMITEDEAAKVQAQVDTIRTNEVAQFPESKWKISDGVKNVELFGDIRLRYEDREAYDPSNGKIDLQRYRYALRFGLRGELFDDFDYGFRLETSSNPRSSWVTFGTSSSGTPYQGPFGKSTAGIGIGQIYLGWHPESWVDITLGKMPNPLYTTPMVWNSSINPEGAAERFKYTVGQADFFATFGQFLYQDTNPDQASSGYFNPLTTSSGYSPFLLASQLGVDYQITKKISFKIASTLYDYNRFNNGKSPGAAVNYNSIPDFSGTYVGQGSDVGINGIPASYNLGGPFDGFFANQTGINDLLVLEIPVELNVKLEKVDLRFFGDFAQNLQGKERAQAAYNASHSPYFSSGNPGFGLVTISSPQTHDNTAYQAGFAIGSQGSLGLVNGSTSRKNAWELRTYWQHIEQYALDPNLLDTDFFEGDENLQGIYAAAAYGLTDNFIATVRYGYATRINDKLGTGGSGQDIPQMNPVNRYQIFQVDLTFRF